jgi:hypothetical protein
MVVEVDSDMAVDREPSPPRRKAAQPTYTRTKALAQVDLQPDILRQAQAAIAFERQRNETHV